MSFELSYHLTHHTSQHHRRPTEDTKALDMFRSSNWLDFYKQSAIRVRDATEDTRVLTCKTISDELVLKCANLKDNSTKTHFKLVRRHCRELGQTTLPTCPRDVYKRIVALESG